MLTHIHTTQRHLQIQAHRHRQTQTDTDTHTHRQTHTQTDTHTHRHTHTCPYHRINRAEKVTVNNRCKVEQMTCAGDHSVAPKLSTDVEIIYESLGMRLSKAKKYS